MSNIRTHIVIRIFAQTNVVMPSIHVQLIKDANISVQVICVKLMSNNVQVDAVLEVYVLLTLTNAIRIMARKIVLILTML